VINVGKTQPRAAWSLGDYSCDSHLSELGAAQRRSRRKGVLKEVKPHLSGIGYEAARHPEKLGAGVCTTKGFVKVMKRILRLFKPLKRDKVAQRRRDDETDRIEKLRSEVSKASRNIENLIEQLRPGHK